MDYDKLDAIIKRLPGVQLMLEAFDDLYVDHRCGAAGEACPTCKAYGKFKAGLVKLADEHDPELKARAVTDVERG